MKVGDKVKRVRGMHRGMIAGDEDLIVAVNDTTFVLSKFGVGHDRRMFQLVKAASPSPLSQQTGGQHYKGMKIQPVEFCHANGIGYMEGNVIKYVCRWQQKNGLEDLEKAKHYIELLIELEKKNGKGSTGSST